MTAIPEVPWANGPREVAGEACWNCADDGSGALCAECQEMALLDQRGVDSTIEELGKLLREACALRWSRSASAKEMREHGKKVLEALYGAGMLR